MTVQIAMQPQTMPISRQKLEFIRQAVRCDLVNEEQPLAAFVDVAGIQHTIQDLQSSFPNNFFHTFAVKANSMRPVLKIIRDCGMGAEVASAGEMAQALAAGFEPAGMIFDEPAKSVSIIRQALDLGINLNIDNFEEFDVVRGLAAAGRVRSNVGFRINPQIGAGDITAMSTATATSKFGVPLEDAGVRQRLIKLYCENPWLNSLHTHVGSQGCQLELMAKGVKRVTDLAREINLRVGHLQVTTIDIGGGLAVNYHGEAVSPSFSDYARVLRHRVPELFTGQYRVLTEFGRSLMAKNGFMISRVEYAKVAGGRHIAITHAGAHVAARTAFMPEQWPLRVTAHGTDGGLKVSSSVVQDIAGPCCFGGDLVAHEQYLPLLQRNDLVVVHDTGAYYFSNPFYYNSLPAPPVYGVSEESGGIAFDTMRKAQTLAEMMQVIG